MHDISPDEPGRRERKKAEQRRALQRAALQLTAEHGYDHLTAEGIAAACDVSTRTFFNYFSSKDEALLGPVMDHRRQLSTFFESRPASESAIDSLRHASIELAHDVLPDRGDWKLRRQVFQDNPVLLPRVHAAFGEVERNLTNAVAERLGLDPLTDPYPALVVALTIASLRVGFMHSHASRADDEDLPAFIARMFDATFGGLLLNQEI